MGPATITCPPILIPMPDLLSDLREALLAAGLDPLPVGRALDEVRRLWGGETIYLRKTDPAARASAVRAMVAKGLSMRAAARELGCSDGTVRRAVAAQNISPTPLTR